MITSKKWFTKRVLSWSLFDFANSSFATIITALVFQIYFKEVVAQNSNASDLWWSIGINISMLIVAFISPVLGAAADHYHNKKTFLFILTVLSVIATASLYTVTEGMVVWGIFLFILANTGFQGGLGFYDAFLKEITEPKNYNKVSSLGYAVGYAGSLFSLGVVILLKDDPRLTFPACAVLFSVFSIPMFAFVKENKSLISGKINAFREGFRRIKNTLTHIKAYTNIRNFLIAYFLYIDGVNTIIFFSANFGRTTVGLSIEDLILFFIIVQISALAGSLLLGYAADKTSVKAALSFSIIAWALISIAMFFVYTKVLFMVLGMTAGIFLGSTQALSRSLMSRIIPDEKKTEFFGFYSLFEKTSAILGPLAFGLISYITGSQRYAVFSIALFFILGFIVLRKVTTAEAGSAVV